MNNALTVHGSIFFMFKKYVGDLLGADGWDELLRQCDIPHSTFEVTRAYPIGEMGVMLTALSARTGRPANELKEEFGEFLVPDLFAMYKSYLRPEWKTLDVIEHTERVMHGAVRQLNSTASPPILNVSRVNPNKLMVDYFSRRRMGSLAIGIIKGIANYFGEADSIKLTLTTDPEEERVQIVIERQ